MQKIIIIGCPGAGKTTFAQKLCDKIGRPLYYLDTIWHKADRTHISREEFDVHLGEILARDAWIIDGHYSRTLERRIAACDTVLLFDMPTEICLAGVLGRVGTKRPDMPWIDEALDPMLEKEVVGFREKRIPTIYALLEKYGEGKNIVIFKTRKEADDFLETLLDGGILCERQK